MDNTYESNRTLITTANDEERHFVAIASSSFAAWEMLFSTYSKSR